MIEQDAIETTKRRHWDIYGALRSGDAEQASAADMIHLSEGEYWLRKLTEEEGAIALASASGAERRLSSAASRAGPAES